MESNNGRVQLEAFVMRQDAATRTTVFQMLEIIMQNRIRREGPNAFIPANLMYATVRVLGRFEAKVELTQELLSMTDRLRDHELAGALESLRPYIGYNREAYAHAHRAYDVNDSESNDGTISTHSPPAQLTPHQEYLYPPPPVHSVAAPTASNSRALTPQSSNIPPTQQPRLSSQERFPNSRPFWGSHEDGPTPLRQFSLEQKQYWFQRLAEGPIEDPQADFDSPIDDPEVAMLVLGLIDAGNDQGRDPSEWADFPEDIASQCLWKKEIETAIRHRSDASLEKKRKQGQKNGQNARAEFQNGYKPKAVAELCATEIAAIAWVILFAVRDAQMGLLHIAKWGNQDWMFEKRYKTTRERLDAVLEAIRANKSLIYDVIMKTPMLRRLAAGPQNESRFKAATRALNDKRRDNLKASRAGAGVTRAEDAEVVDEGEEASTLPEAP